MFGKNKVTRPTKKYDGFFNVNSIFYTIQGEGVLSGCPAVFIRLQGCNLQCSFCDTSFDNGVRVQINHIVSNVTSISNSRTKLVVITGGEPFLQPIEHLCKYLIKAGFTVQIETNGTIWRTLPKKVRIVCSPKFDTHGNITTLHSSLLKKLSCLKFLLSDSNPLYSKIPIALELQAKKIGIPIYVQPLDEGDMLKNKNNTKLTTEIALEKGYNISLQIHKILDIE
ncbi:MAG: 7-carboxy-7-deazaguanine synthase QueE [Alphaproteobacteria bacterium]|nr:7-carboxy-7-deazaguanine synthase QueE [Rickettsiales bacterium]